MSDIRTIKPIAMAHIAPATIGPPPEIEWVDPRSLAVEDRYQRQLSERSLALIHRIVAEFDWRAFKLPIVAKADDGTMMVIDGQHTAIGAASHPAVMHIPVLVVDAGSVEDRARSFLRHNRDRVGMTPMQVHHAAVAAGDEVAVAVDEACRRAGVRILRTPQITSLKVGDTMAVSTIAKICKPKGVVFTARLLKILVDAGLAPIDARSINAVFEIMTDPDWKDAFEPEALSVTIRSKSPDDWMEWAEVNVRKGMKMPKARALAQAWFQKTRKKRVAG